MLKNRANLQVRNLETRLTPAVSLRFIGGNLSITGDNTSNALEIKMTAANQAKVENNGTFLGTYSLTGNLDVRMGNSADTVTVDLNGFNLPGNVTVNATGNGADEVTVKNGGATDNSIAGRLTINLGNGADEVTIGASGKVNVGGGVFLNGGLGANVVVLGDDGDDDYAGQTVLTRFADAKLGGDFGSVVVSNGTSNVASTVLLNGSVAGNLTVTGGSQADTLEFAKAAAATVGGNVVFNAGEGANVFQAGTGANLATINGSLTYIGGNGGNTVEFKNSQVNGGTSIVFGNGDNTYDFKGTLVAFAGAVNVTAGNGADAIELDANASVSGNITLNLGGGANSFVTGTATINSGSVSYTGGSGTDSVDIGAAYTFALWASLGAGVDTLNYSDAASAVGSASIDFGVDFDTDVYLQTPASVTWNQTLLNLP